MTDSLALPSPPTPLHLGPCIRRLKPSCCRLPVYELGHHGKPHPACSFLLPSPLVLRARRTLQDRLLLYLLPASLVYLQALVVPAAGTKLERSRHPRSHALFRSLSPLQLSPSACPPNRIHSSRRPVYQRTLARSPSSTHAAHHGQHHRSRTQAGADVLGPRAYQRYSPRPACVVPGLFLQAEQ